MAGVDQQKNWYIDSGASRHMTSDKSFFKSLRNSSGPSVVLANGKRVTAAGCGEGVVFGEDGNGNRVEVKLIDVLYVPSLASGLVSVNRLTSKGFSVNFVRNGCDIRDTSGKKVVVGEKAGQLYRLKLAKVVKKVESRPPKSSEKKVVERGKPVSEVSWYSEKSRRADEREEEDEFYDVDTSSEEESPLEKTTSSDPDDDWREVRRSRRSNRGVRPGRLGDYVVGA
ncbi:hypothetical protein RP20_CCG004144 [Aedes albopictus]|nr:hypothetical protein RP20_CCG001660 [Aedes albopictus]KXJ62565.1 hypothetical protein RP20_CCG017650 [Aedes albopictus]KXJ83605.1 hypothetical protein RP20_CCG004144 [Aedes albopictus]